MTYAQKLNNVSTLLIEIGHYDKAILSLQRALRLVGNSNGNNNSYTLDGCIAFSDQKNYKIETPAPAPGPTIKNKKDGSSSGSSNTARNHTTRNNSSNKRRRITVHNKSTVSNENNDDDDDSGYIYQRPILIPEGHEMGSIGFLIILFNLALAQHLKATSSSENHKGKHSIKKALLLYEIIFEYWSRFQGGSSSSEEEEVPQQHYASDSVRFAMIMYNNLSQMYHLVDDPTKQRKCLQLLLSTVMVAVDRNKGKTTISQNNNDSSSNDCVDDDVAFRKSLDGFIKNTAAVLMAQDQCAEMA